MTKRMFEFCCEHGHITEVYIDSEVRTIACDVCDEPAERIVSKPTVKLEGVTGDFPTAYDGWERKRTEKLKQEQKKNAD